MKPGDRVAHIDQAIEGIITKVEGNKISFETSEGFIYQFPADKLVKIGEDLEKKLVKQKIPKKDKKASNFRNKIEKIPALDLHLEKIISKHSHLSASAKLDLQLQEARLFLQKHSRSHHREIIIIHGHGKNVLKESLKQLLKEKGYEYYDASYSRYGGGALRIRLKKQ